VAFVLLVDLEHLRLELDTRVKLYHIGNATFGPEREHVSFLWVVFNRLERVDNVGGDFRCQCQRVVLKHLLIGGYVQRLNDALDRRR